MQITSVSLSLVPYVDYFDHPFHCIWGQISHTDDLLVYFDLTHCDVIFDSGLVYFPFV